MSPEGEIRDFSTLVPEEVTPGVVAWVHSLVSFPSSYETIDIVANSDQK